MVDPSPTADLNSVSNLAWSAAVINDSLILGIALVFFGGSGRLRPGFAPVAWNDAAISVNPVGWGFIAAGGCEGPLACAGELEKPVG